MHSFQPYAPPYFEDKKRLTRIQSLLPEIDHMYQEYAKENHFPGYAYGILLDSQLIHAGSGGFSDLDKKIPATPQSLFRVASITKSFTAMAIVKLRDLGKLTLDDPIALYIPEMQEHRLTQDTPAITIRDLLIHSAGFPDDNPWADRQLETNAEDLVTLLKKGLFFSTPTGSSFEYSNLGYTLLGSIVKKITGISCAEFIAREIWEPLTMDASWDFTKIPQSQLAHGYRYTNEQWAEEPLLRDGVFGVMGGMITSIESFSRYAALHQSAYPPRDERESDPLRRSSLREMHQPWTFVKLANDFKYASGRTCALAGAYGYGLQWSRDSLGRVFVGHNGGLPGFGSNWYIMPEYGVGVILFANVTYAPAFKINLDVLDKLLFDAKLPIRQIPIPQILKDRQDQLLKLLPHWDNAITSGIFADNFFLDRSLESLKTESNTHFSKAGNILKITPIVPENQLRGSFIIETEHTHLHVTVGLTPENPSLIQCYEIKEVAPEKSSIN